MAEPEPTAIDTEPVGPTAGGPPGAGGKANVFVSYSRGDQKRALTVIAGLEQAGFQVWWDGLLEGGQTFLKTTEDALHAAGAVVVLWSKTSVDSHWVRDEATHGRDTRRLVPLSIDGTMPPLGFRQFQVIDLAKWRGNASAPEFQAVIRAVSATAGLMPDQATPPAPSKSRISRRAVLAGGATVAAIGIGAATWSFLPRRGAADRNSVAVLPFRNLSGDPSEDYLSQGFAEEIRVALSRNTGLKVFAPESTANASAGLASPVDVARKLGVATLLDGSLRREGQVLRIVATLIDRATGLAAWSEQFDRPMADMFAVQGDIANAVASALAAQAGASTGESSGSVSGTNDLTAHDAYLRGNAFFGLRSGEASLRAALRQYEAAIVADANFAEAHAARARTIVTITQQFAKVSEAAAAYDDALASARRAVELKPGLAIAQSAVGFVLLQGKLDVPNARKPFELSRRYGQGDARVLRNYAAFCAEVGNPQGARAAMARALDLDPLNAGQYNTLAFIRLCERDWTGAIEAGRRALDLNARITQSHAYIGKALFEQGKAADARIAYQAEPVEFERFTGLAVVERRLSNTAAADAAHSALLDKLGDASAYQQAQIYAQWGRADEAIERLTFARRIGDSGLVLLKTDRWMDPLRSRPEFSNLLKGLGFQ